MSASTNLKFSWLGPRLALKVVHGDEAIDRLNLGDQRREGFPSLPSISGLTVVLDDSCHHCALFKKHAA
jgi:hypothetical protein